MGLFFILSVIFKVLFVKVVVLALSQDEILCRKRVLLYLLLMSVGRIRDRSRSWRMSRSKRVIASIDYVN
jgi:hypothetical protein